MLKILFLLLVIIFIVVSAHRRVSETYSRVFPPLNSIFHIKFRRVITPLRPLRSPIQLLKSDRPLPPLFCYLPSMLSPVLDQGRCGSCYAFVIISMMSDYASVKTDGKFNETLNVAQILNCYENSDPCGGAVPEDVLLWLERTQLGVGVGSGFFSGAKKPCVEPDKGIKVAPNSVRSLVTYVDEENIQTDVVAANVLNLKRQLVLKGPFFATISVYKDLFEYRGDAVYTRKSEELMGGHAIEVVGYVDAGVDTRKGFSEPYWVVKNSWGDDFPANGDIAGYFFIRMGTNECGIESRCGKFGVNVKRDDTRDSVAVENYAEYRRRVLLL